MDFFFVEFGIYYVRIGLSQLVFLLGFFVFVYMYICFCIIVDFLCFDFLLDDILEIGYFLDDVCGIFCNLYFDFGW